jgi:hypothetical protein
MLVLRRQTLQALKAIPQQVSALLPMAVDMAERSKEMETMGVQAAVDLPVVLLEPVGIQLKTLSRCHTER